MSVTEGGYSASFTYDGNLKRVKAVMNGATTYTLYSAASNLVYRDAVSAEFRGHNT